MANFIVKNMQYVTTGVGRSRIPRMPNNPSNPPGLAPIGGPHIVVQNAGPGTICYSQQPQDTFVVNGVTVYYAFTSMSGGTPTDASMPYTTTNINQQLSMSIAGTGADVIQQNIYIAHGNYGTGGAPGAIIDAFDETAGIFVSDIFVTVSPDNGTGSVTHDANYLGVVNSTQTEVVTALGYITPTNANFDKWMIMPGTSSPSDTVSGANFTLAQNTNAVAFAYYKEPDRKSLKEYLKEYVKEVERKNLLPEIFKDPKENVEGQPWKDLGDPAEIFQAVKTIAAKVQAMEGRLEEMNKAFIKDVNRPAVGKEIANKANKRGK